jgi:hypothetical protein
MGCRLISAVVDPNFIHAKKVPTISDIKAILLTLLTLSSYADIGKDPPCHQISQQVAKGG